MSSNVEWTVAKFWIPVATFFVIACLGGVHGYPHNESEIRARLSDVIPNCLLTCGIPNPPLPITMQLAGGSETGVNEFPWMGYLVDRASRVFIGGATLITDQYLLTSASLVIGLEASDTSVVLGDHDRSTDAEASSFSVRVDRFIVHPDFEKQKHGIAVHDIAVVRLRSKVAFTRRVRPICLPWASLAFVSQNRLFHQQVISVAGWGTSNPDGPGLSRVLRGIDLSVISLAKCQTQLNVSLPDSVFCAVPDRDDIGNCIGDVGGPGAWDPQTPILQAHIYFAIGVIVPNQRCTGKSPNIFTRVDKYLNFIRRNTNIRHCGTDILKL